MATGKILLIDAYTQGDSYAVVTSNEIGDADITSGDFDAVTGTGDRVLRFNGATGAATQTVAAAQPLHLAITNGSDTVYLVTNESTNQAINSGNTLNFPAFDTTLKQPTQVA